MSFKRYLLIVGEKIKARGTDNAILAVPGAGRECQNGATIKRRQDKTTSLLRKIIRAEEP